MKVTWDHVAARPRVSAVDPATLIVLTAPDDARTVVEVAQGYELTGFQMRQVFSPEMASGLDPTRSYPVVEQWTADRWRVSIADQPVQDRKSTRLNSSHVK